MTATTSMTDVHGATLVVPGAAVPSEQGTTAVRLLDDDIAIPCIHSLADFRQWAVSEEFPQRGRIDYVAGCIEVDMSPQDLYCHGTVNGEIFFGLATRVKQTMRGQIFIGQTRVSSPEGNLSAEPDVLFVSYEALRSGKIVRCPKANDPDRFIEFEGGADLVVEAISDSSVRKDTVRLPQAYYRANVTEFWLVDARRESLLFHIHRRGPTAFEPIQPDAEGYQYSAVMECWYRLERYRDQAGNWAYELKEKLNS
jgi:Uma2 family endonuclease